MNENIIKSFKLILGIVILSITYSVSIRSQSSDVYSEIIKDIKIEKESDDESIKITWTPPRKKIQIIIARSNSAINTQDKVLVSDSITKEYTGGSEGISEFVDRNLAPGVYYYAIISVEHLKDREENPLKMISNSNYTSDPIEIEEDKYDKNAHVTKIDAEKKNDAVLVKWETYDKKVKEKITYTVYRSEKPMSSLVLMNRAKKLIELDHPKSSFLDEEVDKSGTYYYGVSVKFNNRKEILPLIEDDSYTKLDYKSEKNDDEKLKLEKSRVKNIRYTKENEKTFKLEWDPPKYANASTKYKIYQGNKPLSGGIDVFLTGGVRRIGEVNHPTTEVILTPDFHDGTFFGVTVDRGEGETFELTESQSYLKTDHPIPTKHAPHYKNEPKEKLAKKKKPKEKKESEDDENYRREYDDVDEILKDTYLEKKYVLSVDRLNYYLETDGENVGKANFYLGISHYQLKEYNVALDYFLKEDTKEFDEKRTEFWTKKCLENIAKGKTE